MTKPVYTLGISAFYHDSAAALLRDGEIIAAAQQGRGAVMVVSGDAEDVFVGHRAA